MPVVILIVVIIALVIIVNCVKIVPQAHAVVVERLGGYLTTWSVGLHVGVLVKSAQVATAHFQRCEP